MTEEAFYLESDSSQVCEYGTITVNGKDHRPGY